MVKTKNMREPDMKLIGLIIILAALILSSSGGRYFEASAQKGPGIASKFKQVIQSQQQLLQQQPQVVSRKFVQQQTLQAFRPIVQEKSLIVENQEEVRTSQESIGDAEPALYGSVAGTPGIDFPAYTRIPLTRFSCDNVPFNPGMYADEETGCQVFHICYNGRKDSFLCGVGTVFNQANLNCDYWHSVECGKSSRYYSVNQEFGQSIGGQFQSVVQKSISNLVGSVKGGSKVEFISNFQQQSQLPISSTSRRVVSSSSFTNSVPLITKGGSFSRIQSAQRFTSGGKVSPPKKAFDGSSEFMWSSSSADQEIRASNGTNLLSPARRVKLQPGSDNQDTTTAATSLNTEGTLLGSEDVEVRMDISRSNSRVNHGEAEVAPIANTNQNGSSDEWKPISRSRVPASVEPIITTNKLISDPTTIITTVAPETTIEASQASNMDSTTSVTAPSTNPSDLMEVSAAKESES